MSDQLAAENLTHSRRAFLQTLGSAAACGAVIAGWQPTDVRASETGISSPLRGRLKKTLKIGMVRVEGTLTQKFAAARAAGFDGIELNAPGFDVQEVLTAIRESGLPVDGTVIADHWNVRHTDADPSVRKAALQSLKDGLIATKAVGGHTALLVIGHGKDGSESDIWKRSIENIAQAVPLAAELGVHIAIENVWNHFLYDHAGNATQTADKFLRYVDELRSPWVGMQFDIGNHWKYGSMGDWIRQLGHRVIKLDVKGYSRADDKFTEIGEGDIDWQDVRKALTEINFYGWVAAEVSGGGPSELKSIAGQMDRVFGLA
ncbi:MAG: sugar phosphate isomerase/epimerase family protein [Planctomyces sp.]